MSARSAPPEQLDIFAHSAEVMLRNDVLLALAQRQAAAAQNALHTLADAFPDEPNLPAFERLVRALQPADPAPLADHDAVARERLALAQDIGPAARQAFGVHDGTAWLLPLWRTLAARSAGILFLAARSDDHAAASWLQGQAWAEAASAVERIESWRRIPAPLAWMTEARCRQDGLDASWPLLAELAWLAPNRFDGLMQQLHDPLLLRLHRQFGDRFEGSGGAADLAWFPAWALIEKPALAPHLALAQPGLQTAPERCLRLVLELLGLERQGRHQELVQRRRALRDLHAPLYAMYMSTR